MKIYFSANHRNIERDIKAYRQILDAIRSEGHILVNNWVEVASKIWPLQQKDFDWTKVCIESRVGIDDADMVIAEASGQTGFGVGYEVAYALAKSKRVAILIKKSEVSNSYASGLDQSEVTIHEYSADEIVEVVRQMIGAKE